MPEANYALMVRRAARDFTEGTPVECRRWRQACRAMTPNRHRDRALRYLAFHISPLLLGCYSSDIDQAFLRRADATARVHFRSRGHGRHMAAAGIRAAATGVGSAGDRLSGQPI